MGRESCAEIQININFWETLLLKIPLETLQKEREYTNPRVASKDGDFIRINELDVFLSSVEMNRCLSRISKRKSCSCIRP
jgi:hypothetical protein